MMTSLLPTALPVVLVALASSGLAHGQPTSLQIVKHDIDNATATNSQKEVNAMISTVMLTQLKLMSLILEEVKVKTHQRSFVRHSTVISDISTGYPGTVLVQQHYGGTTFFLRSWDEYKFEFGDVTGNYWIGNERLHQLTKDGHYKLRVDLEAKNNGQWYWAEYQTFRVWDESTKYRLDIGGYNGTAGDSLTFNNGMKFSTRDKDNDASSAHCAQHSDHGGAGFWYNACNYAGLNSPVDAPWGFGWYHLPIGSGIGDRKLLTSRLMLMLK